MKSLFCGLITASLVLFSNSTVAETKSLEKQAEDVMYEFTNLVIKDLIRSKRKLKTKRKYQKI